MSSFGRQVKRTVTWRATSAGEPATVTPACRAAAAEASALVSNTTSGTPPFARLAAMGPPMVPSPMKPTRSWPAISGDGRAARRPRPRLLESGGGLEHGRLREAAADDLQAHRQPRRREPGRYRGRRLAREVERVGERG